MAKRDLLTEAMADAKAVKETAIENAKAALTEAFAPHLKSMLAAKLQEMATEEDDIEEAYEIYDDNGDVVSSLPDEVEIDEAEQLTDDLDELLKEIEGEDELDEAKKDEEADETAESEKEDESEEAETEEELNIEDMSEEDLIGFIEDVINDMIETGELEAGEPQEEAPEEETEEIEGEEEIDLDNLEDDEVEQIDEDALADDSVTDELAEAYKTIETLTNTLNEVKLLNAKLLYTNKLFKEKTLTEGKKLQILHAFEKTKSVKEAKTTYEILKENLDSKKPVRESFKGAASKTMAPITENKQPIVEVDAQFARWQKLAGIKK